MFILALIKLFVEQIVNLTQNSTGFERRTINQIQLKKSQFSDTDADIKQSLRDSRISDLTQLTFYH